MGIRREAINEKQQQKKQQQKKQQKTRLYQQTRFPKVIAAIYVAYIELNRCGVAANLKPSFSLSFSFFLSRYLPFSLPPSLSLLVYPSISLSPFSSVDSRTDHRGYHGTGGEVWGHTGSTLHGANHDHTSDCEYRPHPLPRQ